MRGSVWADQVRRTAYPVKEPACVTAYFEGPWFSENKAPPFELAMELANNNEAISYILTDLVVFCMRENVAYTDRERIYITIEVAKNPNLPRMILRDLYIKHPNAVRQNPIVPLLWLEDPAWCAANIPGSQP